MSGPPPPSIRTTSDPLIRRAGEALGRLNARHPWNHNAHFHPWILAGIPARARSALDVGCGRGDLVAALRGRVPHVEGIDPDAAMARAAGDRFAVLPAVRIRALRLEQLDPAQERYDLITMVASLHHMQVPDALARVRSLLRPGGRLRIVTLVRPVTWRDHAWDVGNALVNPLIGIVKHPRPAAAAERERAQDATMPVRDPQLTLAELREAASRLLPGARIRRREGFRVTLAWEAPPAG
ncbi:class I SAM-dependent methyltransferase [Brachybacterium hainanense]|uniref:Class I SAM-dependent methyltransferase n=1 Tax=Brachybacterium hainanense TaxID=1541174 RepID=A0ABV6RJF5_9MICO